MCQRYGFVHMHHCNLPRILLLYVLLYTIGNTIWHTIHDTSLDYNGQMYQKANFKLFVLTHRRRLFNSTRIGKRDTRHKSANGPIRHTTWKTKLKQTDTIRITQITQKFQCSVGKHWKLFTFNPKAEMMKSLWRLSTVDRMYTIQYTRVYFSIE